MNDEFEDDDLLHVLRDPLLWESAAPVSMDDVRSIFEAVDREDDEAAILCESLLTGPSAEWPARLRAVPEACTAGMVRQLLSHMRSLLERRPADALQATSLAIAIADVLDPQAYRHDDVLRLRGQALRDHAYVLSFAGRYAEALRYVAMAERTFDQLPDESFDRARLALVKASALQLQNRSAEAIELTRAAAAAFLDLGERQRYVTARITEAAVWYHAGALQEAMDLWCSVKGDPALDFVAGVRVTHNIGICLCDLGRHSEAVVSFEFCVAEFERLGLSTERTRSLWYLAIALLGTGRHEEAIETFRCAWNEFSEIGLPVDAALTGLDLAEALLMNEMPEQVPAICRQLIGHLTEAGLAMRATAALSLLREAADMEFVSRDVIRETHATLEKIAPHEERPLFRGRAWPRPPVN